MSKLRSKDIISCCLLAVLLVISNFNMVHAGEDKKGYMDEEAVKIMKSMADYLSKAQTMSFTATTFYDHATKSGIMIKHMKYIDVFVKRPDDVMGIIKMDDQKERKIFYNGKSLVRFLVKENTYQEIDFTGDIDEMLDHVMDNYAIALPLADFLYNDLAGTLKEGVISAEYVGESMVQGVKCHHLSFESIGADWQMWVQADGQPVPILFNIKYIEVEGNPEYLAIFKNWKIDPNLDGKMFSFVPPAGAKNIPIKKTAYSATVE